jgi:hypothetical protein
MSLLRRYRQWTLPSKASVLGLVVGVLGVAVGVVPWLVQGPRVRNLTVDGAGPLRVQSWVASPVPYLDGTQIGELVFRPDYSDVRLELDNATPEIIEDINIAVTLDTHIAGIIQNGTTLSDVAISADWGSLPPRSMVLMNEKGEAIPVVPLEKPGHQVSTRYLTVVPKLAAGQRLHLVIAAVAMTRPGPGGGMPERTNAPRRVPTKMSIEGTYVIRSPGETRRYSLEALVHLT